MRAIKWHYVNIVGKNVYVRLYRILHAVFAHHIVFVMFAANYHEAALDLWHVERTVAIFAFRIEKYRESDIIFICGVEE